jgi:hypothetical protein
VCSPIPTAWLRLIGFFWAVVLLAAAGPMSAQPLLDNGVDPANLGKGDWLWEMPVCESSLQLADGDVQGVINFERSAGMQWITVKCGDGGNIWSQFNSDLITRAHAAGLKIFGWAYVYGSNNVSGEINVALNALNLGADGFIIDAEIEYEGPGQKTNAVNYCRGIRASYPTHFLAHAPFPIISAHSAFPYVEFGTNCDAVMPQDYWADIGGTNYAATMVGRMNTEWRNWQNNLTGSATNAIKPIAPIGQGYNSVNGLVDGGQIATFLNALRTNAPPATPGGFRGVSFWSCQHHSAAPDKWPAIADATIGGFTNNLPYVILEPALDRVADAGSAVTFHTMAGGAQPLNYQWLYNGTPLVSATNGALSLTNLQTNNSAAYSVVVTNVSGATTSSVVTLSVYPPQTALFVDDFETNSSTRWTVNESSSDTRVTFNYNYAADGIPLAPHSAADGTNGVKLEANLKLGTVAAVSISPTGQSFTGDYRLHFDLWINVNGPFPGGGAGSTESLPAGIGTAGDRVEWGGPGATADGYWFAVDGDGGVSDTSTTFGDYAAYSGTSLQSTGSEVYDAGRDATARGAGDAYYLAAIPGGASAPASQQSKYPQQSGALNPGPAGLAWHDVIISRRGGTVEWSMDGVRLAHMPAAPSPGNVFVGFWDPFASLSNNTNLSFGLVDNLRVEVPAVPPTLSIFATADQNLQILASGLAGASYTIESSTNLQEWTVFTNVIATNGTFGFTASSSTNDTQRYFRARSEP